MMYTDNYELTVDKICTAITVVSRRCIVDNDNCGYVIDKSCVMIIVLSR